VVQIIATLKIFERTARSTAKKKLVVSAKSRNVIFLTIEIVSFNLFAKAGFQDKRGVLLHVIALAGKISLA
jgi:hypothetical protein